MELASLRSALDEAPAHPSSRPTAPSIRGDGAFIAELRAKHSHSSQPESRQLLAIASALLEVVREEGLDPTPTALFAAAMASLERPDVARSPPLLAGMATLLNSLLPRVPNPVLRAKFAPASALLRGLLAGAGTDAQLARPALGALCQVLAAADPADWPAALPSFGLVLAACADARPKVRRRAHAGLEEVLAAMGARPATLAAASDLVAAEAERVLLGPEAAARAAAAAGSKRRAAAEEAIVAATAAALHALGALQRVAPLLAPEAAARVAAAAIALLPLRQPLLSRHAASVVVALHGCPPERGPGVAEVAAHLRAVLACELSVAERRDVEGVAARAQLLAVCTKRLHRLETMATPGTPSTAVQTWDLLPRVFQYLLPLLGAELDSVRSAAADTLGGLLEACVDAAAIRAAAEAPAAGRPRGLHALVSALESALSAHSEAGWPGALGLCARLFAALGREGAEAAAPLVARVAGLCDGADEGAAPDAAPADGPRLAAQQCMAAALRTLGPRAVLSVAPLGLLEGLRTGAQARTWMLPLLRQNGGAGELGFWAEQLLPTAQAIGKRGAVATKGKKDREAQLCATLESQLWACLPAFVSWAEDGGAVWRQLEKPLLEAFHRNEQYRNIVCNSLTTLCNDISRTYSAAGQQLGHANPVAAAATPSGHDQEGLLMDEEGADSAIPIPAHYTLAAAQAGLAELRAASAAWLPQLLDGFLAAPPAQRGTMQATLGALACVADPAAVARLFKTVAQQLLKEAAAAAAATGAGAGTEAAAAAPDPERRASLLELALALAGGLDARGVASLVKLAAPAALARDPALQKKGYKVLAYVCERRADYLAEPGRRAALLELIVGGGAGALSAARRYRLRGVRWAALEAMRAEARGEAHAETVSALIGEIVLALKEGNAKTRAAAFDLLVGLAHALQDAGASAALSTTPAAGPLAALGGVGTLVTVLLGGLVGASPHMISASVMGLARLLHEFSAALLHLVPDLLPAVLMLLRSRAREVIKSVLGFVKVVASRLPVEELVPRLPAILEGCLLWAEDSKNKFKLKVRMILERLARRCGYEAVEPAVPAAHKALLTHIRKAHARHERGRQGGDGGDGDGASRADARSRASGRSAWDAGRVFSAGGTTVGGAPSASTRRGGAEGAAIAPSGRRGAAAAADPLDLQDAAAGRELMRSAAVSAGGRRARGGADDDGDDEDDFPRDGGGRMVVHDPEAGGAGRKRRRASEHFDSDDSDFEDLRGFSGLDLALKGAQSVARAPSLAASIGGRSAAARSAGGASARSARGRGAGGARRAQHTGERFKSAKAGGDVSKGRTEPYAYWPLDRRLMNRRAHKAKGAKQGLDAVVNAGRRGPKRTKTARD
ncbi:hypothetical protein ACKKBF_B20970 [Auxenochlorella protothecoides x Auxenochlorella symbiontica]